MPTYTHVTLDDEGEIVTDEVAADPADTTAADCRAATGADAAAEPRRCRARSAPTCGSMSSSRTTC